MQEEPVVTVAISCPDESVPMSEHEGEAPCPEKNSAEAGVEDAFDEDVDGFTGAAEPGFEHREADLHAEDQKRRKKYPKSV